MTTTTQTTPLARELLRAIFANPEDDLPRLAYADYLMEQDDDRSRLHGELIALQVQLASEEPGYELDWTRSVKVHDNSMNPKIRRAIDCCRDMLLHENPTFGLYTHSVWRRGFMEEWKGCTRTFTEWVPVMSRHPFQVVSLADREPWRNWTFTGSEQFPWGWEYSLSWYYRSSYYLPPELWVRLAGGIEHATVPVRGYETRKAALDALARACLDYLQYIREVWLA